MSKRGKHAERWVYFQDECRPRIKSGWRGINVIKLGRKWVVIEAHASGKRVRLLRSAWEKLLASRQNSEACKLPTLASS